MILKFPILNFFFAVLEMDKKKRKPRVFVGEVILKGDQRVKGKKFLIAATFQLVGFRLNKGLY